MKTITLFIFTIALLATQKYSSAQSADDMKAWTDYMTPGPVHEMLAKSNGEWSEEITFWMDPGSQPSKASGSVTNKMILGGRYQQSTYTGDMMGMPFEGISILAYDNGRKIFQSSWIDNFGTGITNSEGVWDEATKTLTLTGKQTDPARGNDCTVRETFKIIDDNNQLMEMYGPDPMTGKEYKTMEIKLTRKK